MIPYLLFTLGTILVRNRLVVPVTRTSAEFAEGTRVLPSERYMY